MSSAIKTLQHYTYEDYCFWEGRWELIEGIPYAMSPAPIPKHQLVSANLIALLYNALRSNKCKDCRVYDFIDIKVSEDTLLQPDVSVICKPVIKNFLDFPAALVAEILSPATAFKDRHVKFFLYEQMSIKYFLIIDIDKKSIEINMLNNKQYQLINDPVNTPFLFVLDDDCKLEVQLDNIWD